MKWLFVGSLMLLAGCMHSPAELRVVGKREVFDTKRSPQDAAQCITRSAENYRPFIADPFPAYWRDGEKPGTYEVIVRNPVVTDTVLLAEISPAQAGATVTTWLSPNIAYQDMSERVLEKCNAMRVGEPIYYNPPPSPEGDPRRGLDQGWRDR